MRFLADENIPLSAVKILRSLGHDVLYVIETSYRSAKDRFLFEIAINEKRHLITRDLDFANLISYRPTKEIGILILKIRDNRPEKVSSVLKSFFHMYTDNLSGKLIILDENKFRIRGT